MKAKKKQAKRKKNGSKIASKTLTKNAIASVMSDDKKVKAKKAPKSKAKEATTYDLNPTNEVGREDTPTKVWCQFPCNAPNNLAIQAHLKGQGYRTFASYVVALIVKDGIKDLKTK